MSTGSPLPVTPPVEAVAARAALDAADLSQFAPWRQVLSAGLYDTRGYSVSVRAGHDGYSGPADDTGLWEWKPQTYVNITFRMDPDPDLVLHQACRVGRSGPG